MEHWLLDRLRSISFLYFPPIVSPRCLVCLKADGCVLHSYPSNNCNKSGGPPIDPNTLLDSTFGNHLALINDVQAQYSNTSNIVQAMGKPLIMFETNTASCGGFSGLSDSFGATLWSVDYALQMAYYNFTNALWHVGGVSDYYNVSHFIPTVLRSNHDLIVTAHYSPAR